ncbi:GNAT family N-acetyltransferase [Coralloluteibacterium stylophorae]|uniref:GNAT family N-acetyltransferase n=1 Tax=Coralloluteibacterium stylophorae TaxID=1776034 RepID=A0A8J8AXG8_9GAMM|nr:GNAT family N-acetyltransferase [Coralloluteibacterium stylophorae]MBS7457061.1 GNAT family N-acetyltransferase [Coralloluteibacterium stylophorae]
MGSAADGIDTPRTRIAPLRPTDADFVVALLNAPSFLRFIGDRGVRDRADALRWIAQGPMASHARHGFGLDRVALRDDGTPIGICGLLRRDGLDAPDLGFAFLEPWQGRGFGRECAAAVLRDAHRRLGLDRVLAVVAPGNVASLALLARLGFAAAGVWRAPAGGDLLHRLEWTAAHGLRALARLA